MSDIRSTTFAVVVTFHPCRTELTRLLSAIVPQVKGVVVVDNGSPAHQVDWLKEVEGLHFIPLRTNLGLAAGHNIGINYARNLGARYVVLLDQDSEPAEDMVVRLHEALALAERDGYRVAAVGPNYVDERHNNPPPFIRVEGLRLKRVGAADDTFVAVDYLISSGSLIPIDVLEIVGGMREELFIDYVDIEWGLRAKRHGFQTIGSMRARMRHRLGETPVRWGGRSIPMHTPLRHYYHFRNAVWLYRQSWVPLNWKLVDGYRLALKFIFYSLYGRPPLQHLRMMTLGVWHGLSGRMHHPQRTIPHLSS